MTKRPKSADVQLKVRMKEPLRAAIEKSARQRGVSLNSETVRWLEDNLVFGPPHTRNLAKAVSGVAVAVEDRTGKKLTEDRETFLALQLAIAGVFGIPYVAADDLGADKRKIGLDVAREALAQLGQSGEKVDEWIDAMIMAKFVATEKLKETQK